MLKWLVLLGIIGIVAVIEWMREIHTFKVTHYKVTSPKLKGVKERKVLLISDLHNCSYGKGNQDLLRAIKNEEPELILVAGDMLVGKKDTSFETACAFMEKLPEICPTYYANGNHEQRMKEDTKGFGSAYEDYKAYLQKAGVYCLENESAALTWEDCEVQIHGLEIPLSCYKKFAKTTLYEDEVTERLGEADAEKYHILIAHNPIFAQTYLKWGADLVVSGHLHGGVVRIPFWRGVITPQGGLFPKYSGELTKEGDTSVVVSKGIGLHTIKIRFLNPAEIVVLHIGSSEE